MGRLYTKMKIFHYKDKLDSLPKSSGVPVPSPPIQVRVKPTNRCNHHCTYCAYRADNLQIGQDMRVGDTIPREKMMEILDDFSDMGVKAVTFSGGGEPFTYAYFQETVQRLVDSPMQFAALTNGALLDGEVAEMFAHNGTWLRVSMDGYDDESYSSIRRVKDGEYTKIMSNLQAFSRLGGACELGVSLIVGQENAHHVYDAVSALLDSGVSSVKISPCIVSNEGRENNNYHKPFYNLVRKQIERLMDGGKEGVVRIYDTYHLLDEKFNKNYSWCPYLQVLPVIGADCRVYSCQDKAYTETGTLGSIKDQSFRNFWEGAGEAFYRINPERDCTHHCVANAKNILIHEYLEADPGHLAFV